MPEPLTFESNADWYDVTRRFDDAPAVDDVASIAPDRVEAADAPVEWTVTVEVRKRPLEPGAHLALEVPIHFRVDHGRPYPVGRGHVKHVEDARPGYAIAVDVRGPESADVAFAVSNPNRFGVVDAVVTEGTVPVGETVQVVLGPEHSTRMRAPKFAQEFLFACGIDRDGDGTYRPVDEFPSVTVTGAAPDQFRVIAPSTVDPGEPFAVDVYPADRYSHNPATGYGRRVDLAGVGAVEAPDALDPGEPSGWTVAENRTVPGDVYRVGGHVASEEGVGRGAALDPERGLAGRSNPVAAGWSDRDVYWGEIHVQGYDSIGVGTTEEAFEWGRDVEGLDFCSTANHYGGRYPVTPERWAALVETTNRFDDPGEFVTLVGFEGGGSTDRNVYFPGETGEFYSAKGNEPSIVREDGEWVAVDERYRTAEELWGRLDEFDGDALAFPHHPKTAGNQTDWDAFHDEYQRLVEIYSAWGNSEVGGPHSVRTGLRRGHRVGFTGGTDTHEVQPGNGPHEFDHGSGLTAVYADALTRDGIFEALSARRTYATTGTRPLLDVDVNGLTMGEERAATPDDHDARTVSVRAAAATDVEAVDIVRNGSVVATREPDGERVAVEWTDEDPLADHLQSRDHPDGRSTAFYYVRLRQADRHVAWASPVWFLDG